MSDRHVIEAWLRPAVELNSAAVSGVAAYVCVVAPWAVALSPSVSYVTAGAFASFAALRARQGMQVLRYRRNLRRLPRYQMTSGQVPVSRHRLFLGKGFHWQQKHTRPVTSGGTTPMRGCSNWSKSRQMRGCGCAPVRP